MEKSEQVWQGRIGDIPLRVGVSHAARIIAEWDLPQGSRSKVAHSIEEFERSVLLQLLLSAGVSDASITDEVLEAVRTAQAERPAPTTTAAPRKRKNPKARMHRRSRRPPLRR
jgi:hypothetical protein